MSKNNVLVNARKYSEFEYSIYNSVIEQYNNILRIIILLFNRVMSH